LFYGLWAFHLAGMLLLPKLAAESGLAQSVRQLVGRRPSGLTRAALGAAAFPFLALTDMASVHSVWLPQVRILACVYAPAACKYKHTLPRVYVHIS
jgi:hypothetical protein